MTAIKGSTMFVVVFLLGTPNAGAQSASSAPTTRWSVDAGIGLDNTLSGVINASGIGTLNNQVVVITKNTYEDVYGSGFHLRFGGGYMFRENTEIRGTFTYQGLDADFVTPMGDLGVSRLYGQYTDYQTLSLDLGVRRYWPLAAKVQAFGEGTIGVGFIDRIDVTLVAPGSNFFGTSTDFYDQTAAFALGANAGVIFQAWPRIGVFGQIGLRWMTGMSEIDDLAGTGLDTINDKSSRWTMPLVVGVRYQF